MKVINVAHKGLQSIDTTVANAASIIDNLKVYFQKLRREEIWNDMWKEITGFCKHHDIAVPDEDTHHLPKRKRAEKLSTALSDFFVPTTLGQREDVEEATNAHETPVTVTQPQKTVASAVVHSCFGCCNCRVRETIL